MRTSISVKPNPRSLAAEQAFQASLSKMSATLLEPAWLGSSKPHRVRCAAGHICTPAPNHVKQGIGICHTCAGLDPAVACANFKAAVASQGGVVLEPTWLGIHKPHRVRCAVGHMCAPRPHRVQQGGGLCRICANHDPATAWSNFKNAIAVLGGVVLEPTWLGAHAPHRVRCVAGHECTPTPTQVRSGKGICRICAKKDPAVAWANFKANVALQGGKVLEPAWLGNNKPHLVLCAAGHHCSPAPANIHSGQGICGACARSGFDPSSPALIYLVTHTRLGAHKIGIGATNGRRVQRWLGRGWRIYRAMPFTIGKDAYKVEQGVLNWLHKDLGLRPFLKRGDGWTETVDASIIDPIAIWARVEREALA
jgi:hypothetical protein